MLQRGWRAIGAAARRMVVAVNTSERDVDAALRFDAATVGAVARLHDLRSGAEHSADTVRLAAKSGTVLELG